MMRTRAPVGYWVPLTMALFAALFVGGHGARAQTLSFEDLTNLPAGPGEGRSPSINNSGDVAFWLLSGAISDIYLHDRSEGTFLNLQSLPGAPAQGWYPKLNNLGNVVFIEPTTRELWLFEVASQGFTNLATLPGYPGISTRPGTADAYDINDQNEISLHSGGTNTGDIYLYSHADGSFLNVSDQPGGQGRGRDNFINNAGQIAYAGFPNIHVYDIANGTTTRIDQPAGGLPGGAFTFNDAGDMAFFRSGRVEFYDASAGTLLDLSTLPGYPPIGQPASGFENDLSNSGEITFWQDGAGLFYFDPINQTFTELTGQGPVPGFGMATAINDFGEIAIGSLSDAYFAEVQRDTPSVRAQINGVRPQPALVIGDGPTTLTLDVRPGTVSEPLDWYFAIYIAVSDELVWLTPTGGSSTPAPLASGVVPFTIDGAVFVDETYPPGTLLTYAFLLARGSEVVAADVISVGIPAP